MHKGGAATPIAKIAQLRIGSRPASRKSSWKLDDLRAEIFGRIRTEWELSTRHLLAISGHTELLQSNPVLARSFRDRTPYSDPLNHLQVTLRRRLRAVEDDDVIRRAITLTINGIAAGLRNSG